MAKAPTLQDVSSLNNNSLVTAINSNNDAIQSAFENTLSLDGSTPNAMNADLDMNDNDILNCNTINGTTIRANALILEGNTVVYEDVSDLPAASSLTGSEVILVQQGGVNKRTTTSDLSGLVTQDVVKLTRIVVNNNAQINVALPTGYDAFQFVFQNILPATDGDTFRMRMSADGGLTYASTSGDYASIGTSWAGTTSATSSSTALSSIGLCGAIGTAAGEDGCSGEVWIYAPHLPKKTMVRGVNVSIDDSGALVTGQRSAYRNSTDAINYVRFYCDTTDIASGVITLYGYKE